MGTSIYDFLVSPNSPVDTQGMMDQPQQDNGLVQQLLAARMQQQPSLQDASHAALNSFVTGQPSTAMDYQDQRIGNAMKQLEAIAKLQNSNSGGRGGATLMAAKQLQSENPGMSFMDAFSIAKSGIGQGMTYNNGAVSPMAGAPQAVGAMSYGKASGTQGAERDFAAPIASQREFGKQMGETNADLNAAEASMPQLEASVGTLSQLGKDASYNAAQRTRDTAMRETGLGATEGGKARAAYIAHVKNNVLPLLRRTFGAQFTKAEGDSLLATLGDPNMHPEEKDAVLQAFIQDKKATLQTMKRQAGVQPMPPATNIAPPTPDEIAEYKRLRGIQ